MLEKKWGEKFEIQQSKYSKKLYMSDLNHR